MTRRPEDPVADSIRSSELEQEIRALAETQGAAPAATRAIEGYGPELLGYLFALAKTGEDAEEMFAELCEKLWRALPQFRWDSSFRTWAYAIAIDSGSLGEGAAISLFLFPLLVLVTVGMLFFARRAQVS